MSRHPYYILSDFLEQARRFCKAESELTSPVPACHEYPLFVEVHRVEADLARSGGWCVHFWSEYCECASGMSMPPPIQVSRYLNRISESIKARFQEWGWAYLLSSDGLSEVDRRMALHWQTKNHTLLEAALAHVWGGST